MRKSYPRTTGATTEVVAVLWCFAVLPREFDSLDFLKESIWHLEDEHQAA